MMVIFLLAWHNLRCVGVCEFLFMRDEILYENLRESFARKNGER